MTRSASLGITAAGGAIITGGVLLYTTGGPAQAPPSTSSSYSISIDATPREVDEGDVVEFLAHVQAADRAALDFPLYRWDFDDGSSALQDVDLKSVRHRFEDGDDRLLRVTLHVDDSEQEIFVGVRNVAPTLHRVEHTRPALPGSAVTFEAAATDPGVRDTLTYSWDFGEGATAHGQQVRHAFEKPGRYPVTVTVDDGDGGQDASTIWVNVGQIGWFQVTGDVPLPETVVDRVVLMGVKGRRLPRGSEPAGAPGLCQFRLGLASSAGPPALALTAAFRNGLGQRTYVIGRQTESDGQVRDEIGHADIFFASLALPRHVGRGTNYPTSAPGPFWSQSGYVDVEYFDGKHLEVSFSVTLREIVPDSVGPRTVVVRGSLAQSVGRSFSLTGMFDAAPSANYYMCDRDEVQTFDIAERTPKSDARNVDGRAPELRITFTKPVDPGTAGRNIVVEYGKPAGEFEGHTLLPLDYHEAPGTWERVPGDEHSIRFVPQAHLPDAVIYCVRVRAGTQGIRGRDGEVLEPREPEYTERTYPACTMNAPWKESREWAFSTLVEPESIRLDVYQVSRVAEDVPVVPGKPAVGRVYTIWTKRPTTTETGVNDWSQVKQFPARVTVEAGGRLVGMKRVMVRRPDQFSEEDRRQARNSVNVFGWRPSGAGSVDLRAIVEPVDEAGNPVRKFESGVERVPYWMHSPVLSVDYYFLRVDGPNCSGFGSVHRRPPPRDTEEPYGPPDLERVTCADWRDGVPDGWRRLGHELMRAGALFTTQTFPVIETQLRAMGDLHVSTTPTGPCSRDANAGFERCYYAGLQILERPVELHVAQALYDAAWASPADVVVGLVPPGFGYDWVGAMVPLDTPGKRFILLEVDESDTAAVAHEFGHYFALNHCPDKCETWTIRGFRISPGGASGFNKQAAMKDAPGAALLEGNAEAPVLDPVMRLVAKRYVREEGGAAHPLGGEKEQFQANHQYRLLFDAIASAQRRPAPGLLGSAGSPPESRFRAAWRSNPLRALIPLVHAAGPAPQEAPSPDVRLRVSGYLTDTAATIARIDPIASGTDSAASAAVEGPFALEIVDSEGAPLARVPFAAIALDSWHGSPEGGPQPFIFETPAPANLHGVRIMANGKVLAERLRSAHAPDVRELTAQAEAGGVRIAWQAADADGDTLGFDVELRGADDETWRRAAVGITSTTLLLDVQSLPPGPGGRVRVRATDGFNAASAEVSLPAQRPLTVLFTTPAPDATEVSPQAEVVVHLSNPLRTAATGPIVPIPSDTLRLTDSEGRDVLADVVYRRDVSALILTPAVPLRPGTRYTVTLAAGFEDRWGGRLAEPLIWRFVTAKGSEGNAPQ